MAELVTHNQAHAVKGPPDYRVIFTPLGNQYRAFVYKEDVNPAIEENKEEGTCCFVGSLESDSRKRGSSGITSADRQND
jgi:hypothetical protein